MLAYVALAELPATRRRLSSMLFSDAADPHGALRWTLAELRRALGAPDALRGDPVRPGLHAGVVVDALIVSAGQAGEEFVRGKASALAQHAFALGCELSDPCWEGFGARAKGLIHRWHGEHVLALECLGDAVARSGRVADAYAWVTAYCLEALVAHAIDRHDPAGVETILAKLEMIAGRGDVRELMVRAAMHRARLGDGAALDAVRPLVEAIADPALDAELAIFA